MRYQTYEELKELILQYAYERDIASFNDCTSQLTNEEMDRLIEDIKESIEKLEKLRAELNLRQEN